MVERVTYQNAENGFCVVRIKARGHRELVTLVAHAAAISAGGWITASGNWVNDRTRCNRSSDWKRDGGARASPPPRHADPPLSCLRHQEYREFRADCRVRRAIEPGQPHGAGRARRAAVSSCRVGF